MENIPTFAAYFAHLVWLIVHQNDNTAEQKDALNLALAELAEERRDIVLQNLTVWVASAFQRSELNDQVIWLSELSVRMSAHSVRAIEIESTASAHEVLGLATALADTPVPGDEGEAFDTRIVAMAPVSIAVHLGSMGFVRSATPAIAHAAYQLTPPHGSDTTTGALAGDANFTAGHTFLSSIGHIDGAAAAADSDTIGTTHVDKSTRVLAKELTDIPGKAGALKELLARLDEPLDGESAMRVIDGVAREVEDRARDGMWVDLAEVLETFHQRHSALPDGELRRAYRAGIRRLEKEGLLSGLARLLPRRREMRETVTRLLARAGELGADALIDMMVGSTNTTERSAYRVALAQCPTAIPALIHLLGDERWFVVRNAVELLGELGAPEVENRIAVLFGNDDVRVRRSAAAALARIGSPRAVLTLLQGMSDSAPEVRVQVALGLGAVRNTRAVPWLLEALEKETNSDVIAAIVSALGRMPTDESVERLCRAAEPGPLLRRKATITRVQAVTALAEAATPKARSFLNELRNDRDVAVRQAVERALDGGTPVAT